MVAGLERFRDHFAGHSDRYALIGGSACDLLMENAGLAFRATKDLDIVLIAEALNAAFAGVFWSFIRAGRYAVAQSTVGKPAYYRFVSPQSPGFPGMLEILSARPEQLGPPAGGHLTPIPFDEGWSSISAILLQGDYYSFLKTGITTVDGIPVVGPAHLIPLKARAWLDLTERRVAGHKIDGADINKHRKDVFRLYRIVDPAALHGLSPTIQADMRRFLEAVRHEPVDLKRLGISRASLADVLEQLARIYRVD